PQNDNQWTFSAATSIRRVFAAQLQGLSEAELRNAISDLSSVEYNVDWTQQCMETIQIVLDKKLLLATDQAARRTKRNRSALVRDALREHLRSLEVRAREERDRQAYSRRPQTANESLTWEAEAAWPEE
ncbi:MAG TPA: ribbon-helix-helix protein, CopG family, partial [Candidatus Sulfotelmatobacter sp.]